MNEMCACLIHGFIFSHHTFHTIHTVPKGRVWTINDALFCVCVWLWIARTFWKLCTVYTDGSLPKNSVLHTFTDTRASHPNEIRKKIWSTANSIGNSASKYNLRNKPWHIIVLLFRYSKLKPLSVFSSSLFSLAITDSIPFTDATKILYGTNP